MTKNDCDICGVPVAKGQGFIIRGDWLTVAGQRMYEQHNKQEMQPHLHGYLCKTCFMAFTDRK